MQRKSEAKIVPIAVWLSPQKWPLRRYAVQFGRPLKVPSDLDQDDAAEWLREKVLTLYEQAKQREEQ